MIEKKFIQQILNDTRDLIIDIDKNYDIDKLKPEKDEIEIGDGSKNSHNSEDDYNNENNEVENHPISQKLIKINSSGKQFEENINQILEDLEIEKSKETNSYEIKFKNQDKIFDRV